MNSARLFLTNALMSIIPLTRGFALKRALLRWSGAEIGRNVRVVSSARFHLTGRLVIGDDTWIGHEVLVIGGGADVVIGSNVDIAPRVTLVTGTHELFTLKDRAAGRGYSLPITIEDGAWIGATSSVLGGITIGRMSVVAAGALVNKNVLPGCVCGGVPVRRINTRENRVSS